MVDAGLHPADLSLRGAVLDLRQDPPCGIGELRREPPLRLTRPPVVETALLIRRPAAEVCEAFVDPAVTSRFWFTRGSGRLVPGAKVRWDWEMYGACADVEVKAVEPGRRILITWGSEGGAPTTVEWVFEPRSPDTTFVRITHCGFTGDGDQQVADALDSVDGFALMLAGAKAWLEHGLQLNLVPDRHPNAIKPGWRG